MIGCILKVEKHELGIYVDITTANDVLYERQLLPHACYSGKISVGRRVKCSIAKYMNGETFIYKIRG